MPAMAGAQSSDSPARRAWRSLPAALLGLVLLPLAASHGGFYPTAWGPTALILAWAASLALILGTGQRARGLELVLLAAVSALMAWTLLSDAWTASTTRTMLEGERAAVYVAAVAAVLTLVSLRSYRTLLTAAWCAITLVCAYALATRLFPERLGLIDAVAGYRLSEPLGYWNALGLFAAMGALLALGLVAHPGRRVVVAAAGASLVVLVPTLYFTFSRGAWGAFAAGMLASVAVDPRRLRAVSALIVVAPWPALGVWIASRSDALTHQDPVLSAASDAGHRLALVLAGLAVAAAVAAGAFALAAPRVRAGSRVRAIYVALLLAVVTGGCVVVVARFGSPITLAQRAYDSFIAPPPVTGGNLNRRLFSISSLPRAQQWAVAWDDHQAHPWLGSGAGTYELSWLRERTNQTKVVDAHNLYVEALAELGPVGLLLLVVVLGVPFVAVLRARAHVMAPAAFGAYVAYVLHAAVDWDWEVPALTLTALACGGALVVCARREVPDGPARRAPRALLLAVLAGVGVLSFVGLVGNRAIASSATTARAADRARALGNPRLASARWDEAEAQARRATRWAPWSTDPWVALGQAQLGRLHPAAAAVSFRRAIAKEPGDWRLWYDLARATRGATQRAALRRASRLNPLSPEVSALRTAIGAA
jgi:hypothetical protein